MTSTKIHFSQCSYQLCLCIVDSGSTFYQLNFYSGLKVKIGWKWMKNFENMKISAYCIYVCFFIFLHTYFCYLSPSGKSSEYQQVAFQWSFDRVANPAWVSLRDSRDYHSCVISGIPPYSGCSSSSSWVASAQICSHVAHRLCLVCPAALWKAWDIPFSAWRWVPCWTCSPLCGSRSLYIGT